jgi:hypothetical protein
MTVAAAVLVILSAGIDSQAYLERGDQKIAPAERTRTCAASMLLMHSNHWTIF